MEPARFLLKGTTLLEVTDRARTLHGPDVRIISAERVTVGGIRGFFARQSYEVLVEVPRPDSTSQIDDDILNLPKRLGIAALLDDADEGDVIEPKRGERANARHVSTETDRFAEIMDELTFDTNDPDQPDYSEGLDHEFVPTPRFDEPIIASRGSSFAERLSESTSETAVPPVSRVAPFPLTGAGDLVVVVALDDAALLAARSMADSSGSSEVYAAGRAGLTGVDRVSDSRAALAARARGVGRDQVVFIAFQWESQDLNRLTASLRALGADQVWAVVDASRKPDDTAEWVSMVDAAVSIDAIVVMGEELTRSPQTVDYLGIPVGWASGRPIQRRPTLER
ncbi:hypothetical protein E3O45_09310 [Cryobacterium sp. TMS1-20-1]|uniref:hypothetical protein n=1 Tax=Cryobacterium sp. TMS1-20-1 TaxID=1259223 RepID=UPI00106C06B8|nr:hypothetical protein [Cryobacterium sp. TMS1-20-1]TFC75572.1 hypothetical protein E3O45_09310 [Cryobacterium sp. TMS1-20-1]